MNILGVKIMDKLKEFKCKFPMQFEKYLARTNYIEELIQKESTGTPKEIAEKLGISERMVHHYIEFLKGKGKNIQFCRRRKSYIYYSLQ
jgi:biotin operon repressor